MKKVISTMLALVMVLAVIAAIPMTASAASNTSKYFAPDSTTGLDAFYGTPDFITKMGTEFGAINGTENYTTLKDASWDKAVKVTFNAVTAPDYAHSNCGGSDYDIYILWDDDNLYILQDTRKLYTNVDDFSIEEIKTTTRDLGVWSATSTIQEEHSYYQILLPREMTDLSDASKRPIAYAVGAIPCLNDAAVAQYDIYEGVARVRDFEYSNENDVTGSKSMFTWQSTFDAGVRTFVERLTEADGKTTSYRTATVIPWTFVDSTPDEAFANLTKEEKTNQTIGVWIFNNGAKHIYHDGFAFEGKTGSNNPNDTAGFDTVTLLASKSDVESTDQYYVDVIEPDYAYWLGENGLFAKKDEGGAYLYAQGGQTYEISTAAQLLALANILEMGTNKDLVPMDIPGISAAADKYQLSKGNTFALMNDIDLNPGVTDWAAVNAYYVAKNSGEEVALEDVESLLPKNVFAGFDRFYGTLDGQGYAIKGLFNPDTIAYSCRSGSVTPATGGIIGQLSQGGIVNLYVESGYVGTSALKDNKMFAGLIGEVRTETYTDYENGEITVKNIIVGSNYTVHRYGVAGASDNSNYAFAGVAASVWPGVANKNATVNAYFGEIVYNGQVIDNPVNTAKSNYVKRAILGNNFANAAKTINNGTTKISTTYGTILLNVDATPAANAITDTMYMKSTKGASIPKTKTNLWVALDDGSLAPIELADMFSDVKWQATAANENKFSVRFVAEAYSIKNWKTIGFEVVLNDGTEDVEYDNIDNGVAYTSILAAGETKTAEDLGIIGGDYLYVFAIDDLDASKTYTATVKVVYTDENDNIIESEIAHVLTNIAAWEAN